MTIRIGLIGCGRIGGDVHLELLRTLPGATLVGVAEPDPQRRAEAGRFGLATFDDANDLLRRDDLEAVVIASPPASHGNLAAAAFARGKHVYLEKPLAHSVDEGRAVLDAWRRARRIGMIGFNYRFNPLYLTAKRLLGENAVGRPIGVRTVFSTRQHPDDGWRRSAAAGGGPLLELASHHVDLISFLLERPVVEAASWSCSTPSASTVVTALRLEGGVWVHSFFSLGGGDDDRVEVFGDRGTLLVDRYRALRVVVNTPETIGWRQRLARAGDLVRGAPYLFEKLRSPWHEPSYRRALTHFVRAVRGESVASPDLDDAYRSLEVITGAAQGTTCASLVASRT